MPPHDSSSSASGAGSSSSSVRVICRFRPQRDRLHHHHHHTPQQHHHRTQTHDSGGGGGGRGLHPSSSWSNSSSAAATPLSPPSQQHSRRPSVERRQSNASRDASTSGFRLDYSHDHKSLTLTPPSTASATPASSRSRAPSTFTFDHILHPDSTQEEAYECIAKETVREVLKGFNGLVNSIFAYGQSGSGKTHTMFGTTTTHSTRGIIPRIASELFLGIDESEEIEEVTIQCSFLEIYREVIRDLLHPSNRGVQTPISSPSSSTSAFNSSSPPLKIRELPTGEIFVQGLTDEYVASSEDILSLIAQGEKHRTTAATDMNEVSSRSHSVLIIVMTQKLTDGTVRVSRLNMADLAGSERLERTNATGTTLKEAKLINQSLSALGNCINALTDVKRSHIPFRDSTLTFLLKDSLGGNTKTTLLICCSEEESDCLETLTTLNFGKRAKTIKSQVSVNVKLSESELQAQLENMKKELGVTHKLICVLQQTIRMMESTNGDGTALIPRDMLASLLHPFNLHHVTSNLDSFEIGMKEIQDEHQATTSAKERLRNVATPTSSMTDLLDLNSSPIPSEPASPLPPMIHDDAEEGGDADADDENTATTMTTSTSFDTSAITLSHVSSSTQTSSDQTPANETVDTTAIASTDVPVVSNPLIATDDSTLTMSFPIATTSSSASAPASIPVSTTTTPPLMTLSPKIHGDGEEERQASVTPAPPTFVEEEEPVSATTTSTIPTASTTTAASSSPATLLIDNSNTTSPPTPSRRTNTHSHSRHHSKLSVTLESPVAASIVAFAAFNESAPSPLASPDSSSSASFVPLSSPQATGGNLTSYELEIALLRSQLESAQFQLQQQQFEWTREKERVRMKNRSEIHDVVVAAAAALHDESGANTPPPPPPPAALVHSSSFDSTAAADLYLPPPSPINQHELADASAIIRVFSPVTVIQAAQQQREEEEDNDQEEDTKAETGNQIEKASTPSISMIETTTPPPETVSPPRVVVEMTAVPTSASSSDEVSSLLAQNASLTRQITEMRSTWSAYLDLLLTNKKAEEESSEAEIKAREMLSPNGAASSSLASSSRLLSSSSTTHLRSSSERSHRIIKPLRSKHTRSGTSSTNGAGGHARYLSASSFLTNQGKRRQQQQQGSKVLEEKYGAAAASSSSSRPTIITRLHTSSSSQSLKSPSNSNKYHSLRSPTNSSSGAAARSPRNRSASRSRSPAPPSPSFFASVPHSPASSLSSTTTSASISSFTLNGQATISIPSSPLAIPAALTEEQEEMIDSAKLDDSSSDSDEHGENSDYLLLKRQASHARSQSQAHSFKSITRTGYLHRFVPSSEKQASHPQQQQQQTWIRQYFILHSTELYDMMDYYEYDTSAASDGSASRRSSKDEEEHKESTSPPPFASEAATTNQFDILLPSLHLDSPAFTDSLASQLSTLQKYYKGSILLEYGDDSDAEDHAMKISKVTDPSFTSSQHPHTFFLHLHSSETIYLSAPTSDECSDWIHDLKVLAARRKYVEKEQKKENEKKEKEKERRSKSVAMDAATQTSAYSSPIGSPGGSPTRNGLRRLNGENKSHSSSSRDKKSSSSSSVSSSSPSSSSNNNSNTPSPSLISRLTTTSLAVLTFAILCATTAVWKFYPFGSSGGSGGGSGGATGASGGNGGGSLSTNAKHLD